MGEIIFSVFIGSYIFFIGWFMSTYLQKEMNTLSNKSKEKKFNS